jgi:hypothetical protein
MPLLDHSVLPGAGGAAQFLPNSTNAPPFQTNQPLLSMFGKRETDAENGFAIQRCDSPALCTSPMPSNSTQRCARRRGYRKRTNPSSSDQCNVLAVDPERCDHSLHPVLRRCLVGRPYRSRKAGRAGAAFAYRQNGMTGTPAGQSARTPVIASRRAWRNGGNGGRIICPAAKLGHSEARATGQ